MKFALILTFLGLGAAFAVVAPAPNELSNNSCSKCGTNCTCEAGQCSCGD